jgi:protein-S-isoprenylcysteine O-methyltransferase Ste14
LVQLAFAWFAAGAFALSMLFFLYQYLFIFGGSGGLPTTGISPGVSLVVNALLFTFFAVHHSLFARSGVKRLVTSVVPAALERAVYTLVASVLFAVVLWLWQPVPGIAWALPSVWRWPGYTVQTAGIVLTIVAARALDVWELAGVRQASGRGAKPVVLQSRGLYGFVRHPLYFAWVLMVFGTPEMTMTRLSFAAISTAYLAFAIPLEERSLIETFGGDYASYQRKVRWRMLPGIY